MIIFNLCDNEIDSVEEDYKDSLVKCINTIIVGKVAEIMKYRETTELQRVLDSFEEKFSVSTLQISLNTVRMKNGESVQSFSNRVEELYCKLG